MFRLYDTKVKQLLLTFCNYKSDILLLNNIYLLKY